MGNFALEKDRVARWTCCRRTTLGNAQRVPGCVRGNDANFLPEAVEVFCKVEWLDAKDVKVREVGQVVSMALVLATAVTDKGECEVLSFGVGQGEDGNSGRRTCDG